MNAPANIIPFPAPSLFDSVRRASMTLTADEKLQLIDALSEHEDLAGFREADDIARAVALIRSDINAAPAETLYLYGSEGFRAAPFYGWPL